MPRGVSTTRHSGGANDRSPGFSVGEMFDRIAPTYDLLNHLLSLGRDYAWRRRAVRALPECLAVNVDSPVLDLATGTGDLLIALFRERPGVAEAVGVDISEAMLEIARRKLARRGFGDRVRLVCDDAVRSGLPADSFDAVTMGFGIRNTPDARATLDEIHRVLKPGGTAVILEFSVPRNVVLRAGYLVYLRWFVPVLGALISGNRSAYRYLNRSIEAFHRPSDFCALMRESGFAQISATPLTWGVASIYRGLKRP